MAARDGPDGLPPPDLRATGGPHPLRHLPARAALDVLDIRLPLAVRAARSPVRARLRDGEGQRSHRQRGPHRPRRPVRAPDRGRARLAPGARERLSAARRAPLTRARGASVGRRRGHGALDRPQVRARRLRLELPGRRGDPHRRGLVRPPLPREGHDGDAGRGPPARTGPLPGQLDPPQAARRHGRRRVLRGRHRRPLPSAHRRGHPDRVLLRDRVRPRAARGRGRQAVDRVRPGPLRRLLRGPPLEVRGDAGRPEARPARTAAPAAPLDQRDAGEALRGLELRPLPGDRPAGVRGGRASAQRLWFTSSMLFPSGSSTNAP